MTMVSNMGGGSPGAGIKVSHRRRRRLASRGLSPSTARGVDAFLPPALALPFMSDDLEVDLVLVPVDGSDESMSAVEYAVGIAAEYGADVHAVYVLGEEIVRAIEEGAIEEAEVAEETVFFNDRARDVAAEDDVSLSTSIAYGFSTKIKMRHPGSVVLDTAEELDADFLVVPREPVSDDPDEVLAKAAEYVLLYASQPVLSV
jgi:nucleotide-binding universal stress UspA family protein